MPTTVIPTLRYADCSGMIDWLCDVVGFERHLIAVNEDGVIVHAQLTLGSGMVMLGTARDDDFGALHRQPGDVGGVSQSAYVVVADADMVHDRAKRAGADIAIAPHNAEYGGRFFAFTDPEGHLWSIGTHNPWQT